MSSLHRLPVADQREARFEARPLPGVPRERAPEQPCGDLHAPSGERRADHLDPETPALHVVSDPVFDGLRAWRRCSCGLLLFGGYTICPMEQARLDYIEAVVKARRISAREERELRAVFGERAPFGPVSPIR